MLTGPNRGGKTILTQGIGLAFLMYQCGVFVPASSARLYINAPVILKILH
ncbi:MutS-related protein [uncultured Ruminococcus sp.]